MLVVAVVAVAQMDSIVVVLGSLEMEIGLSISWE
jgi:hypothetical protein